MHYEIDADSPPRLVLYIYHSIEKHADHSALREDDGSLKKCFTKWPLRFADPTEPLNFGFKEKELDNKERAFYSIDGIIDMSASESHLDVRLRLLLPGESLKYVKRGKDYGTYHRTPMY